MTKQTLSAEQQLSVLSAGTVHLFNKEELLKKLKQNRPLKVKAGFDPSSPDLHLGHSLLINKLRQFQELGHEVIFVVGDWTACIGDPSGQNKTRPVLSFEQSQKNARTYKEQATKKNHNLGQCDQSFVKEQATGDKHNLRKLDNSFVKEQASNNRDNFSSSAVKQETKDNYKGLSKASEQVFTFFKRLDPEKIKIVFNSSWFEKLSLREFVLNIASQCTLARQLERDDFKKRFKSQQAIALHELFYPLLQAYDSVQIKADVEIGGTDQLFNLLLGRQLQEQLDQAPQVVLTLPLLEGINTKTNADLQENGNIEGADKMSKSLKNAISFNDSSKNMYGRVMSISDELLVRWWSLFTEGKSDLKKLFESNQAHPKAKKEELAWLLVCSFYGKETADDERKAFKEQRTDKKLPTDIPEEQDILPKDSPSQDIVLVDLLVRSKLANSKSEARRKILEGAVRILQDSMINPSKENSREQMQKITDPNYKAKVEKNKEFIVGVGKRKFKRINTKWQYIHDLKAYLVYRKVQEARGERQKLCEELSKEEDFKTAGIASSSINMKFGNIQYLDKQEGLSNYSSQCEEVFNEYKDFSIEEIEKAIETQGKEI